MLSMLDCVAISGLTDEEIDAIAEHEHLAPIVAAELGQCLVTDTPGRRRIVRMICEDVAIAWAHEAPAHAHELEAVLRAFVKEHPDALPPID